MCRGWAGAECGAPRAARRRARTRARIRAPSPSPTCFARHPRHGRSPNSLTERSKSSARVVTSPPLSLGNPSFAAVDRHSGPRAGRVRVAGWAGAASKTRGSAGAMVAGAGRRAGGKRRSSRDAMHARVCATRGGRGAGWWEGKGPSRAGYGAPSLSGATPRCTPTKTGHPKQIHSYRRPHGSTATRGAPRAAPAPSPSPRRARLTPFMIAGATPAKSCDGTYTRPTRPSSTSEETFFS
jgi:hypothetical protein